MNEYVNAGIEATGSSNATLSTLSPKETFIPPDPCVISNTNHESIGNYFYGQQFTVENNYDFSAGFHQIADDKEINADADADNQSSTPSAVSNIEQMTSSKQLAATSDLLCKESQSGLDSSKNLHDSSETGISINDDDNDGDDDNEEEEEDEVSTSSQSDDSESIVSDEKPIHPAIEEKTEHNPVESAEIRAELSPVMPSTSMSSEITASRETHTALPESNDKSNEIVAKHLTIQLDNEERITNDQSGKQLQHDEQISEMNHQIEENHATDTSKSNDRFFIKPITFETAATMDDVSDAELESYLQELEDLEENPGAIKHKNTINSLKSDDIELYVNETIYNVDNTIENVDEINQTVSRDDRNADSFSQASTVEFGEVNAITNEQPLNENAEQLEQNIESDQIIDSTFDADGQSIETSESERLTNGDQAEDINKIQMENPSELEENDRILDGDTSADLERNIECSECELNEQIGKVARRPNSLNLQNCNTTLIDQQQMASGSALNFSSDENGGSTPAAYGPFLSSSISSNDSNIATDHDQTIVSRYGCYHFYL